MPKLFRGELFPLPEKCAEPMLLWKSATQGHLQDFQIGVAQQDFRLLQAQVLNLAIGAVSEGFLKA